MTNRDDGTGCRDAAVGTLFLLGFAVVFMVTGLTLGDNPDCQGVCEATALTLLYAGGPLSALLGVVFGGVWLAWPLEVTLWVVIGFLTARVAARRSVRVLAAAMVVLAVALVYGLVLSSLVELAI